MRYEQDRSGSRSEGFWQPRLVESVVGDVADTPLLYVVVDDVSEGEVQLLGYPWPRRTSNGGLLFEELRDEAEPGPDAVEGEWKSQGRAAWLELTYDNDFDSSLGAWQQLVNEARERLSDMYRDQSLGVERASIPDRPIRLGDTFAVVTTSRADPRFDKTAGRWLLSLDISQDVEVIDITLEAREAAKTALFGAITPPVHESEGDVTLVSRSDRSLSVLEVDEDAVSAYDKELEAEERRLTTDLKQEGIELPSPVREPRVIQEGGSGEALPGV